MNIAFALAQLGEPIGFNTLETNCRDSRASSRIRVQAAGYMLTLKRGSEVCANALLDIQQTERDGYGIQAALFFPNDLSADDSRPLITEYSALLRVSSARPQ